MSGFLHHKKYLPFIALIALGLITRFLFIWYPAEVVFDEVHFGKFVSAYYAGEYYFDVHPPLGKLLIAGFAKPFGFRAGFDFEKIGEGYGEIPYVALRFLPNLAGALIPLAAAGFLLALGISRLAAFLAGLLLVFDNAMLVQSHFVLVDSFLVFFGLAGLWLFFRARNRGYRLRDIILAGAVLAMSFSVKWTGLAFFGLAAAVLGFDWATGAAPFRIAVRSLQRLAPAAVRRGDSPLKPIITGAPSSTEPPQLLQVAAPVAFIAVAAVVYLAVFWVHFALLPNPGSGDAFMPPNFSEKPFLTKTFELNRVMYAANKGLRTGHPYGSPAWTWPLMARPIFYWVRDFSDSTIGRIYLLGNPFVWWISTFGLIAALFFWRPHKREKKWVLYAGYLMHTLPFVAIKRVVFLYHYLPALGFAIAVLAAWLFDEGAKQRGKRALLILLLVAAIAGFLFFAPLSYGLPLGEGQYKMRIWLESWI